MGFPPNHPKLNHFSVETYGFWGSPISEPPIWSDSGCLCWKFRSKAVQQRPLGSYCWTVGDRLNLQPGSNVFIFIFQKWKDSERKADFIMTHLCSLWFVLHILQRRANYFRIFFWSGLGIIFGFLLLCFSCFSCFSAFLLFLLLCLSAVLLLCVSCFFASLLFCFSAFFFCFACFKYLIFM